MTIDERASSFAAVIIKENSLPIVTGSPAFKALTSALRIEMLEVARDQRHACAEAVAAIRHYTEVAWTLREAIHRYEEIVRPEMKKMECADG